MAYQVTYQGGEKRGDPAVEGDGCIIVTPAKAGEVFMEAREVARSFLFRSSTYQVLQVKLNNVHSDPSFGLGARTISCYADLSNYRSCQRGVMLGL